MNKIHWIILLAAFSGILPLSGQTVLAPGTTTGVNLIPFIPPTCVANSTATVSLCGSITVTFAFTNGQISSCPTSGGFYAPGSVAYGGPGSSSSFTNYHTLSYSPSNENQHLIFSAPITKFQFSCSGPAGPSEIFRIDTYLGAAFIATHTFLVPGTGLNNTYNITGASFDRVEFIEINAISADDELFGDFKCDLVGGGGPTVNLGPDTAICTGSSLTLNAGNPGATFLWNNGATTQTLSTGGTGQYWVQVTGPCGITRDTINIQVAVINPTVSLGNDTTICSGTQVTLNAANSGAAYLWNTGATTQTIQGSLPGSYWVTVTSACGSGSDTIVISNNNVVPTVNLGPDSVVCNGAQVTLNAGNPGSTFLWNTGATTQTISVNTTGQYWARVTGVPCGIVSDTVNLTIAAPLAATTTPIATNCFGSGDGSSTVNPNGGTAPYSYSWMTNPPQNTGTATNLYAGTYTVNVMDVNGCSVSASTTVTQPTDVVLQTAITNAICFGSASGTATVLASGGTPAYTYAWSNGQTNATATSLIAGNHSVIVTDNNGCRDSATVTINEPAAMQMVITTVPVSCQGFSDGQMYAVVSGGTLPYSYLWSPGNYLTQAVTNVPPGTYSVTVTDGRGCSVTQNAVISFPAPPAALAGADTNFCEGEGGAPIFGSAIGGQGAPYYYTWTCNQSICGLDSVFDNDPIANPSVTTTYYLVVTDQRGCQSAPDSVVVIVKPKPLVNAGPDLYLCEFPDTGSFIQASISNAPGPFVYNWTPGTGLNNSYIEDPYARPLVTTIYYLTVTSSNGCESDFNTTDTLSAVTVHVTPKPLANAGPDQSICYTSSTILNGTGTGGNGTYQYQWSPSTGLNNPTIANPTATSSLTTVYILTVISNGCPSNGDTMRLNVNTNPTNDAGPNRDFCVGQSAVLDGSVGGILGNPNFTYQWSPATGLNDPNVATPVANPAQTTMYYLSTTSSSACVSTPDSVLVTVNPSPFPDGGQNLTYCEGTGGILLNGSYSWYNNVQPSTMANFFISWTPAATLSDATIVNPIADPSTTTYYYITTTNLTCSYTDSVLVVVVPALNSIASADTNTICEHDSVQLHAYGGQSGASYSWSPASGLSDPNIANPLASPPGGSTTYTVTVSESGCSETKTVTINAIESPEVSFVNSLAQGCAPHSVSFLETTANAQNWVWDFGDGSPVSNVQNPSHTYTQPGLYFALLTGTAAGDCKSEFISMPIEILPGPIGDFTSDPEYPVIVPLPGAEITFTPHMTHSVSYLWDFGDGQTSPSEIPTHTYSAEGTYSVTLISKNEIGCMTTITHGPYQVVIPEVEIPNIFSPNGDGINDRFNVAYTGNQPFSMEVRDRWGVVAFKGENIRQGWDGRMMGTTNGAPEGVYFYLVTIGEKTFTGNVTMVR